MERYKDKKIAVIGFGLEGESIVEFLMGTARLITVFDEKSREEFYEELIQKFEKHNVKFVFGKIEAINGFDIIFRSPIFHPNNPIFLRLKSQGVEITTSTKLFFELCPCPIIGVTGTKGKGTTSTLIYEILKKAGFDVYLGGNIGIPPLSFLKKLKSDSKVVLELSSFQLIDLTKSPHISVMLMTTSEHLDYHKDVYEYIDAKRNIFRYQNEGDFAVVNRDYPSSNESDIFTNGRVYKVSRVQEVEQGCFIKDDLVVRRMNGHEEVVLPTKELGLIGKHNWENVCAAVISSLLAGATMKSVIPVLKSFKGLEHRLELVATVRGVKYYNDSFSTTPETAIAAIEAFSDPKILILGGSSKNSNFEELGEIITDSSSIKAIIGIGVEWERIKQSIKYQVLSPKETSHLIAASIKYIEGLKSMREVVEKASQIAEVGDVVLLSPACASFDMFKNYKDRGNQFKEYVNKL